VQLADIIIIIIMIIIIIIIIIKWTFIQRTIIKQNPFFTWWW